MITDLTRWASSCLSEDGCKHSDWYGMRGSKEDDVIHPLAARMHARTPGTKILAG